MLQFLNAKFITVIIGTGLVIGAAYYVYNKGYESAENHYKQLLNEFYIKSEKLRTIEEKISREIVIEYKDRVEVVTEKETIILNSTDEQLKQENLECKIGPNFIKLHNEAAIQ